MGTLTAIFCMMLLLNLNANPLPTLWRTRTFCGFGCGKNGEGGGRVHRRSSLHAPFATLALLWRKDARFATNTRLGGVRMFCKCRRTHQRLKGSASCEKNPLDCSGAVLSTGLCRLLALALCQKAGWTGCERFHVAGRAKADSLRLGEAAHSGPRRRAPAVLHGTLGGVQLVSAQTLALEAKQLLLFQQ